MALQLGTRLGPYEITAPIGAGGMGEVYRARDTRLGREVALKILPALLADDPDRLMRFEREAWTLAALNHPHIAHVYGIEDSGDTRALVMELVDGEDLSARIERGQLPLDEALAIAQQIAEALEAAHEAGVIYRDLKPANIKVRPDGTVKVLDFGLAKAGGAGEAGGARAMGASGATVTSPAMPFDGRSGHPEQGRGVTMQGAILGTAAYMAPEQAKGKPVDKRADIWAFGCVLYEMLTGRRAFDGEDVTDTIAAVVTRDPHWLALPPSTPASVHRLLARCLAKDRKLRLRDIGDAQLDLVPGEPESPTAFAPAPRHAPVTIAIAVIGVVSAALLAWPALSHWRAPSPEPRPLRLTVDAPADAARLLSPVVSPDGRAIAFSSIAAGRTGPDLWVRRLDDPALRMIPNIPTPGAPPFWSPDARALVFPTSNALLRIDLANNTVQRLARLTTTLGGIQRFFGTWSPAGVILYSVGDRIFILPESGGEPRAMTLSGLPDRSDNRFPVFLPDGRRFLFLSNAPGDDPSVFVASIDGGAVTRLFPAESQAMYTETAPGQGHIVFVRDANLTAQPFTLATMQPVGEAFVIASNVPTAASEFVGTGRGAFSVSSDGVIVYSTEPDVSLQRLTWFDRQGKPMATLGEPALYFGPRIAPDGHRVAVARLDPRTRLGDIYVFEEQGGSVRLTFDAANDVQPVWTPSGTHIIWGSTRRGKSQLMRKRADGAGPEEVLHESGYALAPDDVTRDGQLLVFRETHPETSNDLWVLPLDGSGPARPILNTRADEPRARFSPDGSLIGYISDESGTTEAYVQPFPAMDGKWQLSHGGSNVPQWRRDGKEMYYSGASLYARAVLSTTPLRLAEPVALFPAPLTARGSFFHASPDGARFLFAVSPSELQMLQYHVAVDWVPRATTR